MSHTTFCMLFCSLLCMNAKAQSIRKNYREMTFKNVSHEQDPTHTLCASQSFYAKGIGMVWNIENHFGAPSYRTLLKYKTD